MSRVGKKTIEIPEKTTLTLKNSEVTVTGEKGTLRRIIHPDVNLKLEEGKVNVVIKSDKRTQRALQGLTRSLVNNMVIGVSRGFEKILEVNGIGYRAEVKGKQLVLNIGYSHPINFDIPEGIFVDVDKNNKIKLSGIDKEKLGQTAASIRQLRPPEPYKGKGIKYAEERIQKKAGKSGTK